MSLIIFSSGSAWEVAFAEALRFLERPSGTLLLGPSIGEAGKAWVEDKFLSARGVRFGTRIQTWQEWVKARARDRALSQGRGFRTLNKAARREHLRIVGDAMKDGGAFHHLQDMWSEEKFFSSLLDSISEARLAGITDPTSIERAKELLATNGDEVSRESYEDFWNLLQLFEQFLQGDGGKLDEASLLRLAAEDPDSEDLFLLGFDQLSLLEAELIKKWALGARVEIPFALPESRIAEFFLEKGTPDHPAELALQGLLTGFGGSREHLKVSAENSQPRRRLLEAHSPSEEARAAAALARAYAGTELRFVVPEGYFTSRAVVRPFRDELALPENFHERRALHHPVARLFFHALSLKEKGFPLWQGLELAKLLEFTTGSFDDLASRAARAGIRKGLADWKRKAGSDPVLQSFAGLLEKFDRELPSSGTAAEFAKATEEVAKWIGIAELARRAPNLELERDAHAALAGVLRNAQMLATSTRKEHVFRFEEWIAELKSALSGSLVGEVLSLFPRVQFYHYGEWLPPASTDTLTIALGMGSGAGPSAAAQFFLEEGSRRRLSEFLLPTQVQQGLCFLDQVQRIANQKGHLLFSRSKHTESGGEDEPHWVMGTLDLEKLAWPEVPREESPAPFSAQEKVIVGDPGIKSFSASLFELYKACPFKAFAEKVLRLEDKVQESSLDLSRLEEGSFVHKVLELYYGEHRGKEIVTLSSREETLALCLEKASAALRVEYFKGNEVLLEEQLARLKKLLLDFLNLDAENYSRFPFFGQPQLEKSVGGKLAGKYEWKGKIDRVDIDEKNKRFLITDYKIGANPPSNAEVNGLERFQLQLYLDAVEEEREGWEAIGGVYSSITSGERNTGLLLKEFNSGKAGPKPGEEKYFQVGGSSKALHEADEFDDLRMRTREEAARLAERISSGDFSVTPLDEERSCKLCSVRPACRVRELRAPPVESWPRPPMSALLELLKEPEVAPAAIARAKSFNPEQSDALSRRGEMVFIEASAGTGKTTVIVERVRRFLEERKEASHLAVEKFRAISFTEKSAQELAARIATSLLADEKFGARVAAQAQSQVSTIHGFCRKIISDFPIEAGVSPLAAMLDDKGAEALRRETIEDFFLSPSEEAQSKFTRVYQEFSRAKVETLLIKLLEGKMLFADEAQNFRNGGTDLIFSEGASREVLLHLLDLSDLLANAYEKRKREASVLDFNDLEALSLEVLNHEHARAYYQKKFELLLVDEFQDTNSVQREIFERVARPGWSNVFVVGDAKQSIYRFRAADVSVFQGLRSEAEKRGNLVTLGRNYRSRKEIVEVANRITSAVLPAPGAEAPSFEAVNSPAIPELPAGAKVALVEFGAPDQKWVASERRAREAQLVAKLVKDLQGREAPPKTIAILLRKFSGNEAYLRALTDAGVSFRVGASKGFYGQSIITDSIGLLRVLYGAKNDIALLAALRSPWCRIDDKRLLEIQKRGNPKDPLWDKLQESEAPLLFAWKKLATHCSLSEVLERALREYPMGRREHLQSVKLLGIIDALERDARTRAEIVELLSSWAGWSQETEATDDSIMPEPGSVGTVQVMTVHAAKGLEFEVTILADLCGKLVPDNSALRMVRGSGMVLKLESEEKSEKHTELGRRNTERELAELKRLFYVAVTRAQKEEYFFLPRSFGAEEAKKWNTCAHFLRAADLTGLVEKIDGDSWALAENAKASVAIASSRWEKKLQHDFFRSSSITEIADFNTCREFHRLKNIQHWDDRIVDLWQKDAKAVMKKRALRKAQTRDPESERVAKLLKQLKIERKERGIALHRVLERIKEVEEGLELAPIWLREAYEAQGVSPNAEELLTLISIDIDRLGKFLRSDLGKSLFAENIAAFPEVTFQWKVESLVLHGAIDRLIQKPDGSWVVVDYKSSIQEQSLEDYRFQVASYMAAVREHAGSDAHVSGYLVDLFTASSILVEAEHDNAMRKLRMELKNTAQNYTPSDTKPNLVDTGLKGGDHCFSCPYSFHCEIGKVSILDRE